MMNILVTGGAGYIGSHTIRLLLESGYNVLVLDSLENGHKESLPTDVPLHIGNLKDREFLEKIFSENTIDAVIHFAGYIEAGESMKNPKKFYDNNVFASLNLLEVMRKHKVNKIVFSSSAGVYGQPDTMPITEECNKKPVNHYGMTKLMVEQLLDAYSFNGIKNICLRYFNASGAGFGLGEHHEPETHLIPLILQVALGQRENIKIFGTDYSTKDGTCVRDYIHVLDLAKAHVLALKSLEKGNEGKYNVGTGEGVSVKEIIEIARQITNHPIPAIEEQKRDGDPASLVASSNKIKEDLGFEAQYDIKEIIQSAWKWHKNNPNGFRGQSE